jgi:hypothetical protein
MVVDALGGHMKASLYARMQYVTPQNLPGGWPVAPALYDPKVGM